MSAAAFSLGHGGNDAQKTMGVILAVLIGAGYLPTGSGVPLWVVLCAHTAIGLGTLTGGWRIVKTMGSKITRLQPVGGVAAESAAAATLFFTSHAGIPVSTTHTITGAIVGVGASRRLSAVRWGVAGRVVWAWIVTIPGAWLIATATYGARVAVQLMDRRAVFFLGAAVVCAAPDPGDRGRLPLGAGRADGGVPAAGARVVGRPPQPRPVVLDDRRCEAGWALAGSAQRHEASGPGSCSRKSSTSALKTAGFSRRTACVVPGTTASSASGIAR